MVAVCAALAGAIAWQLGFNHGRDTTPEYVRYKQDQDAKWEAEMAAWDAMPDAQTECEMICAAVTEDRHAFETPSQY